MAKAKKQDVALRESHDVQVLTDKPDWLSGKARGNENVGIADLVLPRIELVQPLSPCKDKRDPAFIPGAEDGNLFNTVSRENYGDSVSFIPVFYRRQYLLFRTRKAGGGFRGSFNTNEEAEAARRLLEDPSNHEVIDCGEHIVLVHTEGGWQQAILAMTKTKQKISRQLNSLVAMTNEDRWARVYQLGSVQQKNDKGTYYNYAVRPMGYASKEAYIKGTDLHNFLAVSKGENVRAAYDDTDVIDGDTPEM